MPEEEANSAVGLWRLAFDSDGSLGNSNPTHKIRYAERIGFLIPHLSQQVLKVPGKKVQASFRRKTQGMGSPFRHVGASGIRFVRVTQAVPGVDDARVMETTKFIEGLWEKVSPIMTGKEKAEYEPPPVSLKENLLSTP